MTDYIATKNLREPDGSLCKAGDKPKCDDKDVLAAWLDSCSIVESDAGEKSSKKAKKPADESSNNETNAATDRQAAIKKALASMLENDPKKESEINWTKKGLPKLAAVVKLSGLDDLKAAELTAVYKDTAGE